MKLDGLQCVALAGALVPMIIWQLGVVCRPPHIHPPSCSVWWFLAQICFPGANVKSLQIERSPFSHPHLLACPDGLVKARQH